MTRKLAQSAEVRFFAKVEKSDGCWNWIGNKIHGGYGRFWIDGKYALAHRVAYTWAMGSIPDGMQIDHTCHNRACVNPGHLRVVTHKQNQENLTGSYRNSKSGIRGVHWQSSTKKWRAVVKHYGSFIHCGLFADPADAANAVLAKRLELYTHNDLDRSPA